ncbi:MAG: hypothetical protein WC011_03030 [Candidatus Paceibacterota bacterium]
MDSDSLEMFPVDQVTLVDLGNWKCKLSFALKISAEVPIGVLASTEVQDGMADSMCYTIGFCETWLKEKGLILAEIEIIVPHKGSYLKLADNLINFFAEKNIIVRVFSGVIIEIPDYDINLHKEEIDLAIDNFKKTMFQNN